MSANVVAEKARYMQLLVRGSSRRQGEEEATRTTPVFSWTAKQAIDRPDGQSSGDVKLPQYGLLGFYSGEPHAGIKNDDPIFLNTNSPSSIFLCGSQGSGKSYTLACMLEDCLLKDEGIGKLQRPLAGVVFHYDVDSAHTVCEAAYLCSRNVPIRILATRSAIRDVKNAYEIALGKNANVTYEILELSSHHLSIERMQKLMAFSEHTNSVPLYMELVQKILRDMACKSGSSSFNYQAFKSQLKQIDFDRQQEGMLSLRLTLLESFMEKNDVQCTTDLFETQPGTLTIIDLSDPFLEDSTACMLFDICLGIIKDHQPAAGMVIALDEAHKYLKKSAAAENFTDRLLTTIREQRHNATRVFIATQEPTISDKLLDLCSVTIVHRFTSPAWFTAIKTHLAGASFITNSEHRQQQIFERIINLNVGQSLLFSPSALLHVENDEPKELGVRFATMQTRLRTGVDGGLSALAYEG